ncbi:MAG: T9SS type A sorting domain-containing protein [Paludibacter sp.]|nr:T9SS type A sorting domain-containing protein [Paludibacter sp.]
MKTKRLLFFMIISVFTLATLSATIPTRKGWWKFDDPANLMKATIGNPLTPYGDTPNESVNGPADGNLAISDPIGHALIMDHGIAANGGGALVNEYSFQIDFYVPSPLPNYVSFFQTGAMNAGDGDLFIKGTDGTIGLGVLGWSAKKVVADTWYRMVVSAKCGEYYRVYIDGELYLEKLGIAVDSRHALEPLSYIFGDDDGEDPTIYCSELAVWNVPLTEEQAIELGNATTADTSMPVRKGLWQFDDSSNLTKATIGTDLVLTGTQTAVAGPTETNHATMVPLGSYLTMNHGMSPNLAGTLVNEWTLQVDFSIPKTETWYSFFQTGALTDDADLFVASSANSSGRVANSIGTAQTGYSTNTLAANTWYRMLVSVKNDGFFKVYIDGVLWLDAPAQGIDGRWGLDNVLQIFQDNDGDDGDINCSELGIWDVALTADQALQLGNATNSMSDLKNVIISKTADLGQNYPNPFTQITTFPYQVKETGNVSFHVLDVTGREIEVVNEGLKSAGDYKFQFKSNKLTNGIYYVQMSVGNSVSTRKMIVVR